MKLKCLIIYLNVCGILWLCKWLKNKCATLCAALVAGRIDQIYAKFACWQHKIDIREEAADETAKRILYTLSILKHRLPTDMTRLYFCLSLSAVINDSQFLQRGAMLALYYRHDMTYSVLKVPHNIVNFGPLAAEIGPVVWGTPPNSTGFVSWQHYCTALQ